MSNLNSISLIRLTRINSMHLSFSIIIMNFNDLELISNSIAWFLLHNLMSNLNFIGLIRSIECIYRQVSS